MTRASHRMRQLSAGWHVRPSKSRWGSGACGCSHAACAGLEAEGATAHVGGLDRVLGDAKKREAGRED